MATKISLEELHRLNPDAHHQLVEQVTEAIRIAEIQCDDRGRLSAITALGEVFHWGDDTGRQWVEF